MLVEAFAGRAKRYLIQTVLTIVGLAAAFAGPALAETFVDSAPVLSVRAITERTPVNREECWSEQRRGYEDRRVTRQSDGAPIGAEPVSLNPSNRPAT